MGKIKPEEIYTKEGQKKYCSITIKLHAGRTLLNDYPDHNYPKKPTEILTEEEINDLINLSLDLRLPPVQD